MPVIITYTATVSGKCWKQHTCYSCSCLYRYKLAREAKASAGMPDVARSKAEQQLSNKLAHDIDVRPCPHCGLVQPDMATQGKIGWYIPVLVLSGLLLVIFTLAASSPSGLPIESAAPLTAGIAGIAGLIYACVALGDPNADRAGNKKRAEADVFSGQVQVDRPGTDMGQAPAPAGVVWWLHGPALIGVLGAAAAFLAPLWATEHAEVQTNVDVNPSVVGPGEQGQVFFQNPNFESVKGAWRGSPTVQVLNAAELGVPETLPATSQDDKWPTTVGKVRDLTSTPSRLHAAFTLPGNAELVGKTIRLKVVLNVTYPVYGSGKAIEDRKLTMSREVEVRLSSPATAAAYRSAWTQGSVAGLLGSLLGGCLLLGMAMALRSKAGPNVVLPLHTPPGYGGPGRFGDDVLDNARRRWGQ
jgi:hypothetical protein